MKIKFLLLLTVATILLSSCNLEIRDDYLYFWDINLIRTGDSLSKLQNNRIHKSETYIEFNDKSSSRNVKIFAYRRIIAKRGVFDKFYYEVYPIVFHNDIVYSYGNLDDFKTSNDTLLNRYALMISKQMLD